MIIFFYYAAGIIFLAGSLMTAYWFLTKVRKKNYERNYHFLFGCVSYYVVNDHNFKKIYGMFRHLRLHDQDPELTNALWRIFQTRYNEYFQDCGIHIEAKDLIKN
jgi:hypothetical protein